MEEAKYIIALGFFDGVHRGHARIVQQAVALAAELGLVPAALTFGAHPRAYVRDSAPKMLTTLEQREALLRRAGAQEVFIFPFDQAIASMPAEAFVSEALVGRYACGGVVCGENFRFGRGAQGTPELLRQLGTRLGLAVRVVEAVTGGDGPISSTGIRQALAGGQVEQAAQLLGRPFALEGMIVPGTHIGHKIGFPTLNFPIDERLVLPAKGVYAGAVAIGGRVYPAVTNVGTKPTFASGDQLTLESHLLDYNGNAYGQVARTAFLRRLREERAFSSGQELAAQIEKDAAQALEIFHQAQGLERF